MIKIALCDDEESMVNLEKDKLIEMASYESLDIKTYTDSKLFLEELKKEDFHIICLDIEMPNVNGMELAREIRAMGKESLLIFITNYENKVFQSLHYTPFRFIRKRYLEKELEEAIFSAKEYILKSRMVFTFEDKRIKENIPLKDVLYLEVKGHFIYINTINKQIKFRGTMKEMEEKFVKYDFIRPHISFLVNPAWIYIVEEKQLVLENKSSIPLSRSKKEEVKQQFAEYLGRRFQ